MRVPAEEKENRMNLRTLFRHRSVWMGIAILFVVFYHTEQLIPGTLLANIRKIAYGGADIFLFASGLGAYFSYTRDCDATAFIMRRIKRLAPVYLPFIAVWGFYKYFMGGFPIRAVIGNFLAVQGFTELGNEFNWYITCLVTVYLLTPFFAGLINRMNGPHSFFLLLLFLLIVTIPFWSTMNSIIVVTRLPIFVIGMYFARMSEDGKMRVSGKLAMILAGSMLVGIMLLILFFEKYDDYLWRFGLYWYPFILITPGLCIFISAFAEMLWENKIARVFLDLLKRIGEYSFEIYLVHLLCFDVYYNYLIPENILPHSRRAVVLVLMCVPLLCLILRMCSKGCIKGVEVHEKSKDHRHENSVL